MPAAPHPHHLEPLKYFPASFCASADLFLFYHKMHLQTILHGDYLKTWNKKKFGQTHEIKIQQYLEARDWLKEFYPDGKMLSLKSLQEKKESLKAKTNSLKDKIQQERVSVKDLEMVLHNIDAILNREAVFTHEHTRKSQEYPNNNYIKKQKEETL